MQKFSQYKYLSKIRVHPLDYEFHTILEISIREIVKKTKTNKLEPYLIVKERQCSIDVVLINDSNNLIIIVTVFVISSFSSIRYVYLRFLYLDMFFFLFSETIQFLFAIAIKFSFLKP